MSRKFRKFALPALVALATAIGGYLLLPEGSGPAPALAQVGTVTFLDLAKLVHYTTVRRGVTREHFMNSFVGISQAQTTNLAVVAPGSAEALFATAIGLVAAIPAVVTYNIFARSITGYRLLLADAASDVERLVSRNLDFRSIPAHLDSGMPETFL